MGYTAMRIGVGKATVESWYTAKRQKAYMAKSNLERVTKDLYLDLRKEPFTYREGNETIVSCYQCRIRTSRTVFVHPSFIQMQTVVDGYQTFF